MAMILARLSSRYWAPTLPTQAEMGSDPKGASPPLRGITGLPTELILQILGDRELSTRDMASFAATCRRFKIVTHPLLYRRFDWIAPLSTASLLERWFGPLGMLLEALLEPLMGAIYATFGIGGIQPDKKSIAFEREARFVREMSVLSGYQFYMDYGMLIRYYGPRGEGDCVSNLFHPFENLTNIELDERAALSWTGYLTVVAEILVTKPKLEELTLRHRLGLQPADRIMADMLPVRKILAREVVAKPKTLSIILGRRFEGSEMGYRHFEQLMETLAGAVAEVVTFQLFASYSNLDENDTLLKGMSGPWVMPKLHTALLHVHGFPTAVPVRSVAAETVVAVKKLQVVCDIVNNDLEVVKANLSMFQGLEELEIWNPMWAVDWEYFGIKVRPPGQKIVERLSTVKDLLPNLKVVRWALRQQDGITTYTLEFPAGSPDSVLNVVLVEEDSPREKLLESLPERLRYIKQGYILANSHSPHSYYL
ncbi:hypothetical protein DRE_07620 [Drechslerella stenobrocha 248]|uniref:F-box domain-containing protein n=1 Tax=Drechslerella stenobrocha 248 TaxID=1043628 RepID=W7HKA4_9PEZI|nr:hypothetical protein DRE_07620 [Drechslerella stenobrocha 248]